jgi:hypothetical protein
MQNTNDVTPRNADFFRLVLKSLPVGLQVRTVNGLGWYKRNKQNDFCLFADDNRERSRWGDVDQMASDLAFFEEHGQLPEPDMPRW